MANKDNSNQKLDIKNERQSKQKRLQYEKMFVIGYKDLLRQDPFWLEGKSQLQLEAIMEKYVNLFHLAYGNNPAWYIKTNSNEFNGRDKMNLQRFEEEMKHIHFNKL